MRISYQFTFKDGSTEKIEVDIDEVRIVSEERLRPPAPEWTRLEYHQCSHCPLDASEHPHCPVALRLVRILESFERANSFEEVDLEVDLPDRMIKNRVPIQQGISALMGLVFASSGCPHTDFMKPMARFHLPLASEEDTMFRATGMYLIAQYYRKEAGLGHDFEFQGLKNIYASLHRVNSGIAARIRSASSTDSSLNAVVLLDMLTHFVPFVIEDRLNEMRHLFHAYVSDGPLGADD